MHCLSRNNHSPPHLESPGFRGSRHSVVINRSNSVLCMMSESLHQPIRPVCLLPPLEVVCLADPKMIRFLNLPSNLELDFVLLVQLVKFQIFLFELWLLAASKDNMKRHTGRELKIKCCHLCLQEKKSQCTLNM
jgi:hypothetical protein